VKFLDNKKYVLTGGEDMDLNAHNINAKVELLAHALGYFFEDDVINNKIRIHEREQEKLHCSFCLKSQDEVDKLIAGPRDIYICNECVELCNEIINEEKEDKHESEDNK
jgi:hypothetical protein